MNNCKKGCITYSIKYTLNHFAILSCIIFYNVIHAEDDSKRVNKQTINQNNKNILLFDIDSRPLFYMQTGIGTTILAQKTVIPTFFIGFGFYHQFYEKHFNIVFGYKMQLFYEVGVKSLSENTLNFTNAGFFSQLYIGRKRLSLYGGAGYGALSIHNPPLGLYRSVVYGFGINIIINNYSAIDIGMKFYESYKYKPQFLLSHEFRF